MQGSHKRLPRAGTSSAVASASKPSVAMDLRCLFGLFTYDIIAVSTRVNRVYTAPTRSYYQYHNTYIICSSVLLTRGDARFLSHGVVTPLCNHSKKQPMMLSWLTGAAGAEESASRQPEIASRNTSTRRLTSVVQWPRTRPSMKLRRHQHPSSLCAHSSMPFSAPPK